MNYISTPVNGRGLTQTCCCTYQSICCGWKRLSGCSITLALNLSSFSATHSGRWDESLGINICEKSTEMWRSPPCMLRADTPSSDLPSVHLVCFYHIFCHSTLSSSCLSPVQFTAVSVLLNFSLHSSAMCWQSFPNQVLVKCRRKWVNLAPAVKPWKLWLSSQPS